MKAPLRLITLLLLVMCTRQDSSHRLRAVTTLDGNVITLQGADKPTCAEEGQTFFSLTVTLPDDVVPDATWSRPVLIDDAGAEHRFMQSSISTGTGSPSTFSATFQLPEQRRPTIVRIGNFDIDPAHSAITPRHH